MQPNGTIFGPRFRQLDTMYYIGGVDFALHATIQSIPYLPSGTRSKSGKQEGRKEGDVKEP